MPKGRPPNLRLQTASAKHPSQSNTIIELETPIDPPNDDDLLPLSSPSSTSSDSPPESPIDSQSTLETDSDPNSDDISRDLAALEKLRRSVHRNLKLRPIRSSTSSLRAQAASPYNGSPVSIRDNRSPSPASSLSPASVYYTPTSALYSEPDDWRSSSSSSSIAGGIEPALLISRLNAPTRPILIDTRPTHAFLADHLEHSVNIHTIPSLILKRSKRPNGGLQDITALRQWITTDEGKHCWDDMMNSGDWDGDVIVYDETMDEQDRLNPQATAWILLNLVEPLLEHGTIDYLHGGFSAARHHPYLRQHILSNHARSDTFPSMKAQKANGKLGGGLFQLDISVATRPRDLPELEFSAVSPKPMMPSAIGTPWHDSSDRVAPSPAPSQLSFSRPPPPRRPSIPALRKLDTTSTERLNAGLPRLQMPQKAATLAAPPSGLRSRSRSRSPSHLRLNLPPPSPPGSARLLSASSSWGPDYLPPPSPSWAQPSTPRTPHTPHTPVSRSPSTARPDSSQPPTTEEPFPMFTVSTILPNFLFLGPELTKEEHVDELQSLGVKRILNLAIECDDDQGLNLRERFDRYIRIPMRDTVEEDNITRGVREVCEILDDARLHSSPTYVHCKAGKSRSVTAVMAYLIHANHWTLSRAYSFVLERRKGISPNIGFVSELMTFEEQELGGKSVGVVKMSSSAGAEPSNGDPDGPHNPGAGGGGGGNGGTNYGVALGGRRPQHIRESLPPLFSIPASFAEMSGPPVMDAAQIGDSGQEVEIKDATGRYRHARRAPVDEATLQPMRRVSKAGLESAAYV
ncbi:uncharacterized protein TRAVEDRAFT_151121 [Trametes versicolor FP-101664 SS1]|uniref:uncharacterized protein n=1 Tax=Trametes versicolor (strain FP-101664) TaxID=717944 RepID=UPI00046214B6|nr:uncharacterized protein TRAVEDRAFT_151121 [Trametes versicolor FP-101664 SS1]EIW56555.1 hypothetical protein TRAVEDRAFT_151121 [Trametes versicolor FP-101664 SS1]